MSDYKKVAITLGESQQNCTFRLYDETHTIGNAVRHILARNADTEYVAYSISHPSEPYLNLRLQTYTNDAQASLLEGLTTLGDIVDHITEEFDAAIDDDMAD